jgi:hypothetical protein
MKLILMRMFSITQSWKFFGKMLLLELHLMIMFLCACRLSLMIFQPAREHSATLKKFVDPWRCFIPCPHIENRVCLKFKIIKLISDHMDIEAERKADMRMKRVSDWRGYHPYSDQLLREIVMDRVFSLVIYNIFQIFILPMNCVNYQIWNI